MNVDGITAVNSAAVSAIEMGTNSLRAKIGMAVLEQVQDQQKQMGEALVKMVETRPGPGQPGYLVDRLV